MGSNVDTSRAKTYFAITLRRVDLPAPFLPTKPYRRPFARNRLASFSKPLSKRSEKWESGTGRNACTPPPSFPHLVPSLPPPSPSLLSPKRCDPTTFNPFTPKSDQYQISPAISPEILHHTVWRTWFFIACSDERWLHYLILATSLIRLSLKRWENVLFELGTERVKLLSTMRPLVLIRAPMNGCLYTRVAHKARLIDSSCPPDHLILLK